MVAWGNHTSDGLFYFFEREEKEWRLINEEGDIALSLPVDISAIIFGLKMPSQNKATIKNILSDNPNIIYRQAEKVANSFKLKIVDC